MAVDFFGPVMPRQRLQNTAARANAIVNATNAARHPRGVPSATTGLHSGINRNAIVVYVSNDGEDPIKYGEPVLLQKSVIVDPSTDREEWRKCEFVDGGLEFAEGISGVWGVALQLIEPGFAGPVLLSGVTTVTVTKRPGEDLMVDMPCFRGDEEEGNERKLYTSAAGCAIILDIPETEEDNEEVEAIVHVLGYRTAEPLTWAYLDDDLYGEGSGDGEEKVLARVQRRVAGGGWNNVPGRFAETREVETRCFKLGAGQYINGYVEVEPDPWSGIRYVRESIACPGGTP